MEQQRKMACRAGGQVDGWHSRGTEDISYHIVVQVTKVRAAISNIKRHVERYRVVGFLLFLYCIAKLVKSSSRVLPPIN